MWIVHALRPKAWTQLVSVFELKTMHRIISWSTKFFKKVIDLCLMEIVQAERNGLLEWPGIFLRGDSCA